MTQSRASTLLECGRRPEQRTKSAKQKLLQAELVLLCLQVAHEHLALLAREMTGLMPLQGLIGLIDTDDAILMNLSVGPHQVAQEPLQCRRALAMPLHLLRRCQTGEAQRLAPLPSREASQIETNRFKLCDHRHRRGLTPLPPLKQSTWI